MICFSLSLNSISKFIEKGRLLSCAYRWTSSCFCFASKRETNLRALIIFVLPAPFGPTMTLGCSKGSSHLSWYVKKFSNCTFVIRIYVYYTIQLNKSYLTVYDLRNWILCLCVYIDSVLIDKSCLNFWVSSVEATVQQTDDDSLRRKWYKWLNDAICWINRHADNQID